ncbi:MAG: LPP20 family lipoprotein [Melioribacteraceae bacterium]|nr:LPP20 family lipoprotein [Melioribacteraceae bacterium]
MKRHLILFLALILTLFISSCGGTKEFTKTDSRDIPEWYLTTPTEENYLYAAASATSRDMDLAISKASTEARAKLARTLEVKVNSMQKKFEEEIGTGENSEYLSQFTQATKTVVSKEMKGSQISKKELLKDGKNWRAYVLAKYPTGSAQKAFLKQIESNKKLYTRFRASEAFNELDNEVYKNKEPTAKVKETKVVKSIPEVEETVISDDKKMIVNYNNFIFELTNVKYENRNITISLIVKNTSEDDSFLKFWISDTRIFDESGNEYIASNCRIANTVSKDSWTRLEKKFISGVPTTVEFVFKKVSSETKKISLFSISFVSDDNKVEFRSIPIDSNK